MVKDHSDSEKRKEGNVLFNDTLNTFMVKDHSDSEKRKEGNVLFNDTLNTFMVKDHSDSERGRKEMFYLMTHSTHLW